MKNLPLQFDYLIRSNFLKLATENAKIFEGLSLFTIFSYLIWDRSCFLSVTGLQRESYKGLLDLLKRQILYGSKALKVFFEVTAALSFSRMKLAQFYANEMLTMPCHVIFSMES